MIIDFCLYVLGGAEVDNVGDSGEDSEDEWNYYRVEPTGDKGSDPQDSDVSVTYSLSVHSTFALYCIFYY